MGRGRTALHVVAAAYVVGLAGVLFLRIGAFLNYLTVWLYLQWNFRLHWPGHPMPQDFGFALNVVLFAPVGLLLVLLARRPWWQAAVGGTLLSACVELVQALPFLHRYPSAADVAANGLGALLGALAAAATRRRSRRAS